MSDLHGIPKQYGMIVVIFGLVFFFPLLGFTIELVHDLNDQSGWSVFMFGLTMVAIVASILMIGYGTNMVWYHDKKIDDRTIDEKANGSEFRPTD